MSVRPLDAVTARRTCVSFRRKTDYYALGTAKRPAHELCPEYPWCERTAGEAGPDGGPVRGEECAPGRSCFRPVLMPEA